VRNALVALDWLCIAVSPASVAQIYEASLAAGLPAKDMLLPHVLPVISRTVLGTSGDQSLPSIRGVAGGAGVHSMAVDVSDGG